MREHGHRIAARGSLAQPRRRQQLPSSSMSTAPSISHATGLPKAGTNTGAQCAGSQGARGEAVEAATHRLGLSSTWPQRTQLHSLQMRRTREFRSRGARPVRRLGLLSSAARAGTPDAAARAACEGMNMPSSSHFWYHQPSVVRRFGTLQTSADPQRPRVARGRPLGCGCRAAPSGAAIEGPKGASE